jgi:putative FmdB family regulatory protein
MTYEYVCEACGHQWEAEQSIKDRPLKTCVSCSKDSAKRLVSGGTGFLLKGGGWYADLYGSSKAKPAESSEKTQKSETSEKAEAKPAVSDGGTKDAAKPTPSSSGGGSSGSTSNSSASSS